MVTVTEPTVESDNDWVLGVPANVSVELPVVAVPAGIARLDVVGENIPVTPVIVESAT